MSTIEERAATARALFEHASRGELDAFPRLVAPEFVIHSGAEDHHGPDGLAEMVEGYRQVLAGLRVTIEHQFGDGDYVATRFTVHGRHEGEFLGAPPTGRDVSFGGITISRFEDGRLVEEWEEIDALTLLGRLGVLPAPAPS